MDFRICLLFAAYAPRLAAAILTDRADDAFSDPAHDQLNPLRYITSNLLAGIAFGLVMVVAIAQTYLTVKHKAKWMLSMTIGAYTFAVGLAMRFGLHIHPRDKGIYTAQYLFVVLSPCAFIAAEYILLGRLAQFLRRNDFLLVSPRKITVVFIASDIATFLIQAAGGGLSIAAKTPAGALTGSRVFLAGLAIQLLSFATFTAVYLVFLYRVSKTPSWTQDASKPWFRDWRALAAAISLSCVGILIRSAFRTVELSEGFAGPLATREELFYGLDTLPLFVAIAVYVPFWPARFISADDTATVVEPVQPQRESNDLEKVEVQ